MKATTLSLALLLSTTFVACTESAREDHRVDTAETAVDVTPTDAADALGDTVRADTARPDDAVDTAAPIPFQTGVEVETTSGSTRGREESGGLRVFKGIPFAEPPVGDNRLRAPQPAEPWDGVHDAGDYGPSCMQLSVLNDISEDCLTLNVWAHTDEVERPVMVWIYGGAFIIGETAMPTYDGADLAQDADVVVVTLNYRLGVLSNLAIPELRDEDPMGSVGNMGLLDQIEALRWIKANAAAFGGDPDNITVFGESAGAISTCALMGTELADDLFHKAIVQSGNCHLFSYADRPSMSGRPALEAGESLVEQLGCAEPKDRLQCLRALDASDFVGVVSMLDLMGGLDGVDITLGPTIDGVVLTQLPYERIIAGEAPPRPVIFGSNGNEGSMFAGSDVLWTRSDLEGAIAGMLGGDAALAAQVADLYPITTYPVHRDAYSAFVGEVLFNCNAWHAARAMQGRAFYYHLMQGPLVTMTLYGPLHAADVFYVFGNFTSSGVIPTVADIGFSGFIQNAWGEFARTGVPQFAPEWPAVDAAAPQHLEINLISTIQDHPRGGRCDALQQLGVLP